MTHLVQERSKLGEDERLLGARRQLQEMEKSPFTRNEHYLADYREKFLTHYKALRRKDSNSFVTQLDAHGQSGGDDAFKQTLNAAMSSIQSLGFHNFKPEDIPRLLPADPYEPAIEIMADVRAYVQGSYSVYSALLLRCLILP